MHAVDWAIVIALNGAIIAYGLFRSRGTQTSSDWFLAGRTLPWWMVGLSLYATAIDSSDLVADAGGVFNLGVRYFVVNWVGVILGWFIAANFIALPMYRAGMYTNAEYLEARFGPAARVISAAVQVQYRTMVLGIIATTIYLTLSVACGWGDLAAWSAVAVIALIATIYTALGGLRSVAVTDALQAVVMIVASLVLFVLVWNRVGGWSGTEAALAAHEPGLEKELLHVGSDQVEREGGRIVGTTPAWLFALSMVIAGMAYSIVNHTQSMRLFGARSEWDLKMSATVAGAVMLVMSFTNLSIGVMGRAVYPDPAGMPLAEALQKPDSIYPLMVLETASVGLAGLVVAGILAASFSTFDSIGSTLSSLLVRDVYARLMVKDRDDRHYLSAGRWLTPFIIFGSFLYIPFLLQTGMVIFYLNLVGAFVVPLLTLYLMGVFTPVHRRSGTIGMLAGVAYGVLRLVAPDSLLPEIMTNVAASYAFSMAITAGVMILASLVFGWEPPGKLQSHDASGWLRASRDAIRQLTPSAAETRSPLWPALLGAAIVLAGLILSFVVFW